MMKVDPNDAADTPQTTEPVPIPDWLREEADAIKRADRGRAVWSFAIVAIVLGAFLLAVWAVMR